VPDDSARLDELAADLLHGPRPVTVVLAEPDPAWAQRYARHEQLIRTTLGGRVLAVEHIGSTAVPGLVAKPVVDIVLVVADPDDEPAYLDDLMSARYDLRVRETGHRCLRAGEPDEQVNLHVTSPGSADLVDWLLLRDHLRANPADRDLYAATKRSLTGREWADMNLYADAKGPVIREILARARAAG
jgi:GrpB-like predicted nucleotidyltransferase (UPF0157 family)